MSQKSFELDPLYEFRAELGAINYPMYKEIAEEALTYVPDYYFFVPASSSGKYHPKSSLGMGGLVTHVRSVFALSEELLTHPLFAPFSDEEKDEIRVAILLHDCLKQGKDGSAGHTVIEHPLLVRDSLYPHKLSDEDRGTQIDDAWDRICSLIETHMGIWTKDKEGNKVLNEPETPAQLFVHMCDFIASRKIIDIDVTPRDAQDAKYGKKDVATDAQVGYVTKLAGMCSSRRIPSPVPSIVLTDTQGKRIYTKEQASTDINKFKEALGLV